jgi:hypothetical protein
MTGRKPGAAFLVTVVVSAAVPLYPLTFGPAVWLVSREHVDGNIVERAFRPILWAAVRGPKPLMAAINWWANIGIPSDCGAEFTAISEDDGDVLIFFGRLPFGVGTGMRIRTVAGRHLGESHLFGSP